MWTNMTIKQLLEDKLKDRYKPFTVHILNPETKRVEICVTVNIVETGVEFTTRNGNIVKDNTFLVLWNDQLPETYIKSSQLDCNY